MVIVDSSEENDGYRSDSNIGDVLYNLSVNFLLYVTVITVFYMLVRFYLEEETSAEDQGYIIVPVNEEITIEMASSDIDIEIDNTTEYKGNANDDISSSKNSSKNSPVESSKNQEGGGMKRQSSFLNVNEWVEPEGTKMEVLQKVIFCALGLNISFVIWGLIQERMLTRDYDGEYFVYSYGLVFINRIGGFLMSAFLMYYYKVEWVSTPLYEYSFPSVANMLSSWCQYEALKYVSFPTVTLAKAFKMLPVMLVGKFMHGKKYEPYEYFSAAAIGFGIYLFLNESEPIELGVDVLGNPEGIKGVWCGLVLLVLFLFFDSFTAQWQTRMFELKKDMSPLQMMVVVNAFSAVLSGITLVHQEEFTKSFEFLYEHPSLIFHLMVFIVSSTIGQIYIYYTVKNFGAVVFSIIMSMRILFSILLSCLVYSHPITELGFVGIVVVFGAITYRTKRKTEGQPLIRYKGVERKARNILQEWHEHLDI